jgi:hypothetical protein
LMPDKIDESMGRICGAVLKPRRNHSRVASAGNGKE